MPMKTRALGLALGLLACRHAVAPPSDRPAPPPHAPQALDVAASPEAAPAEDPLARRLSAMADELAERMAVVRGLAVRRPVARGVMSRAAVVDRLRRRTRAEYPPGELELEGETLKRLGLIPESIDYERTMFDLLEEQVLGFYDPDEHRLYMADWVPAEMQTSTMAHEVTHALQDQHFDIGPAEANGESGADRKNCDIANRDPEGPRRIFRDIEVGLAAKQMNAPLVAGEFHVECAVGIELHNRAVG